MRPSNISPFRIRELYGADESKRHFRVSFADGTYMLFTLNERGEFGSFSGTASMRKVRPLLSDFSLQ